MIKTNLLESTQTAQGAAHQVFTENEWEALGEFFKRLRAIYGRAKYEATFPSKTDTHATVKEFGREILKLSPEELDLAINHTKQMIISGEDGWEWPNVGRIISATKQSKSPAHNLFLPMPELTPEQKAKNKEVGRKAIAELRAQLK